VNTIVIKRRKTDLVRTNASTTHSSITFYLPTVTYMKKHV
jgi:hypothetical protein